MTILSGDLMQDDEPNFANNGDNAWHVVLAAGLPSLLRQFWMDLQLLEVLQMALI
ncbi:MAG: hypothetical protein R2788_25115 [Saprospiraceae bacterium]